MSLVVGLDLREVSGSGRGYRRMMELVYELDALAADKGEDLGLELFSDRTPLIERHDWTESTSIVSPKKRLRVMARPLLGHLRTALWGEASVVHFPTADCWDPPTCSTVVTLHDLAPLHHPEWFFDTSEAGKKYHEHLHRIFRVADRVVTVSDTSLRDLVDRFPGSEERVCRIYQGVDPEFHTEDWYVEDRRRFRENIGAREGYILYCGGIDARKNLTFLLEAFRIFKDRTGSARKLAIVGNAEAPRRGMERVPETIERLGLEESVLLLGWVSDPFLRRVYCAASLFAFPSRMEGFGYAPLEAMACGCPVLCSDAAALPETVGQGARTMAPDDPEAWAEAMATLLDDMEARKTLVQEGFEQIKKYDWKQTAREFSEVYRDVGGSPS